VIGPSWRHQAHQIEIFYVLTVELTNLHEAKIGLSLLITNQYQLMITGLFGKAPALSKTAPALAPLVERLL